MSAMRFNRPKFLRKRSDIQFADSANAERLKAPIDEFLREVVHEEALFISDESSVWDFDCSTDDGAALMAEIKHYYGVSVTRLMLDLPLWRLVEAVEFEIETRTASLRKPIDS